MIYTLRNKKSNSINKQILLSFVKLQYEKESNLVEKNVAYIS